MESDIYYHIYNRGAHKSPIFLDQPDYERMLKLLYIANSERPFIMAFLPENVFTIDRGPLLVHIIAYCLMPNHIHIALNAKNKENVSKFMKKLCTAYSIYFNLRYKHSGTIWQGTYKAKEKFDNTNLQILIDYIHGNPFGLKVPGLSREEKSNRTAEALEYSKSYEYSSYKDYMGEIREQTCILKEV